MDEQMALQECFKDVRINVGMVHSGDTDII